MKVLAMLIHSGQESEQMAKTYTPPSREGLVALTVFVKPEVRQALKIIAAEQNTTIVAILDELIAKTLKKHGREIKE